MERLLNGWTPLLSIWETATYIGRRSRASEPALFLVGHLSVIA